MKLKGETGYSRLWETPNGALIITEDRLISAGNPISIKKHGNKPFLVLKKNSSTKRHGSKFHKFLQVSKHSTLEQAKAKVKRMVANS